MAKIIRKTCRVAELPPNVVMGLDAAPDQEVRVTIAARRRRDVDSLLDLTRGASREARRRGLTEAKLARPLDDRRACRRRYQRPRQLLPAPGFGALAGVRLALQVDELVMSKRPVRACADPTDDKFLEAAVNGNATIMVTGDRALLAMQSYRNVQIMTCTAYVRFAEGR